VLPQRESGNIGSKTKRTVVSSAQRNVFGVLARVAGLEVLDGTVVDVADSPENERAFGRPSGRTNDGTHALSGAYPQAKLVALAEGGTRAMLGGHRQGWPPRRR
jgi:hypothetical protein